MNQSLMSIFSWKHVRAVLNNILTNKTYVFISHDIYIEFAQGYSIVINEKGRGFLSHDDLDKPAFRFLAPKDVQEKVQQILKENVR